MPKSKLSQSVVGFRRKEINRLLFLLFSALAQGKIDEAAKLHKFIASSRYAAENQPLLKILEGDLCILQNFSFTSTRHFSAKTKLERASHLSIQLSTFLLIRNGLLLEAYENLFGHLDAANCVDEPNIHRLAASLALRLLSSETRRAVADKYLKRLQSHFNSWIEAILGRTADAFDFKSFINFYQALKESQKISISMENKIFTSLSKFLPYNINLLTVMLDNRHATTEESARNRLEELSKAVGLHD